MGGPIDPLIIGDVRRFHVPWELAIDERVKLWQSGRPIHVSPDDTKELDRGWFCRRTPYIRTEDGDYAPGARYREAEVHWTRETGALLITDEIAERHRTIRDYGKPTEENQYVSRRFRAPVSYVTFSRQGSLRRIYHIPDKGTFTIYGAIFEKWLQMQMEEKDPAARPLWPTTDETGTPDGRGRFNHLENGSIYWTPETGAHFIHGPCRDRWATLGWEKSYLGYPISSTSATGTEFERGTLSILGNGQIVERPNQRVIHTREMHTPDGTPVRGWSRLVIQSNGVYEFRGNVHCSGAPSYDVSVAVVPIIIDDSGGTKAWIEHGDVEGFLVIGGSVDHPWDHGLLWDSWITKNWDQLKSCDFQTTLRVDFSPEDFFKLLGSIAGGIAVAIGSAFFLSEAGEHTDACGQELPDGSKEVVFVPKGQPCPPGFHK